MIDMKLIGIIYEKNTLELLSSDNKRFYFKLPSEINALKKFKIGESLIFKNGVLRKPQKKKSIPGQLTLEGLIYE
jgi:hypothetical protein